MAFTFPKFVSKLSQSFTANNFTPCQSALLAVTSTSSSVTMTAVQGNGNRLTYKITNSGNTGCYVAVGQGSATAVNSTSTPTPTSGTAMSTCDYIASGAIITQDYPPGYDTIAAKTASSTTTLEITIGYGQ